MRNPAFSSAVRSGAPVVTTIQQWLSVSGGAAAKAEPMETGSICFRFVDWLNAPANDTATIGTQSDKALLKRLLVACLACVDIPITLLPIGFVLSLPNLT